MNERKKKYRASRLPRIGIATMARIIWIFWAFRSLCGLPKKNSNRENVGIHQMGPLAMNPI